MARRIISNATKLKAVQAYKEGERATDVIKRFKINSSMLYRWANEQERGKTHKQPGRPLKAKQLSKSAEMPDEQLSRDEDYAARVRRAIKLLRDAEEDVDRRKREGKLREADNAHLYAGLALRLLQGDNGK
jgi:transposase-like protein